MNPRLPLLTLSILSAAASPARAGEPVVAPITKDPAPSRWRIGAGYAPLIGLKAEFSGLGRFHSDFSPQPLGGKVGYKYDDGFVRVDLSGNIGGETSNWDYQHASQYDAANGGS